MPGVRDEDKLENERGEMTRGCYTKIEQKIRLTQRPECTHMNL
jgi:hypothetical protein